MEDSDRSDGELTMDELARRYGVEPVESVHDMACDGIFESDEDVEAFIAFTYACRRRDVA